jgi:hypothetical protein
MKIAESFLSNDDRFYLTEGRLISGSGTGGCSAVVADSFDRTGVEGLLA